MESLMLFASRSLFDLFMIHVPINQPMEIAVMTDGASHRNGGMCGIGVHIINAQTKEVLAQVSESIGEGTNSFAEYTAFTRGVQEAIKLCDKVGATKVFLLADSNLVVSQVTGAWKASKSVSSLVKEAKKYVDLLRRKVDDIVIDHIPREYNHEADALSTQATEKAVEQETEEKYPFLSQ